MAIKIAFFNHKGGVGKTTNVYHLGWMLANKGKTVLFIDLDSQCNLTQTILGEQGFEKYYEENPKENIKDLLAVAFESRPKLLEAANCIQVKGNEKLWLVPGSLDITQYEVQLGISFQLYNSFSSMKHLPGAFNYLIEKTAEKYQADYVLIDLNPSLSAINQGMVMSSDYFIIPAAPDYYSLMAVRSLAKIVPQWESWAKEARLVFADETYPFPNKTPKFLGYTFADYAITRDKKSGKIGAKKATEQFAPVMNFIKDTFSNLFLTKLKEKNEKLLLPNRENTDYFLAEIPNFSGLGSLFHRQGLPVFEVKTNKSRNGSMILRKEMFTGIYNNFAEKILTLTQDAEHDTPIQSQSTRG